MEELWSAHTAIQERVPAFVARYREAGVLTWRLLHRIEREVIAEVASTGRHPQWVLDALRARLPLWTIRRTGVPFHLRATISSRRFLQQSTTPGADPASRRGGPTIELAAVVTARRRATSSEKTVEKPAWLAFVTAADALAKYPVVQMVFGLGDEVVARHDVAVLPATFDPLSW